MSKKISSTMINEALLKKHSEDNAKKNQMLNQKLEELYDWGFKNDMMIDAYLKADHQGIFPYISWVEMTEEQKKMRDEFNSKKVRAERDAAKSEKLKSLQA